MFRIYSKQLRSIFIRDKAYQQNDRFEDILGNKIILLEVTKSKIVTQFISSNIMNDIVNITYNNTVDDMREFTEMVLKYDYMYLQKKPVLEAVLDIRTNNLFNTFNGTKLYLRIPDKKFHTIQDFIHNQNINDVFNQFKNDQVVIKFKNKTFDFTGNKMAEIKQHKIASKDLILDFISRTLPAVSDMYYIGDDVSEIVDVNGTHITIETRSLKDVNNTSQQSFKIDEAEDVIVKLAEQADYMLTLTEPEKKTVIIDEDGNASMQLAHKTINLGKIKKEDDIESLLVPYKDDNVFISVINNFDIFVYDPTKYIQDTKLMESVERALDHPLNVAVHNQVYCYGASGSGKTTLAIEYAKKKGIAYNCVLITSQTTVDDLMGYFSIIDHTYHPSLVRDAVEHGKLLILDEMDAGNPNTMLALNSLVNDNIQFPDRMIKRHPDFRVIGTGNTIEFSEDYNARNKQDRAFMSRFEFVRYDLDRSDIESRFGKKNIKQIVDVISNKPLSLTDKLGKTPYSIDDLNIREIQRLVIDNMIEKEKQ